MNKFSINDWLTIQTRKDLTFIKRSLERESVDYALFADIFIAVFSFVMDHVLWTVIDPNTGATEQVTPSWYWICTAFLLVAVPALIFLRGFLKRKQYQADLKKVLPVDYLVDLFDNEICYNAMTADSMRDHLNIQNDQFEDEIQKFYFIEASYYANKTTTQLYSFKIQGKKAIQTNGSIGGVSFSRFQNVCDIVYGVYKSLINCAVNDEKFMPLLKECESFIYNFNDLVFYMGNTISDLRQLNELKIDYDYQHRR